MTGSGAAVDPVVSPQRGSYSNPAYNSASRAAPAGVSTPGIGSYPMSDSAAARSSTPSAAGFRSGAKDYTSPAAPYGATAGASGSPNGAIIPRYGAAADRYSTSADRASPTGTNRFAAPAIASNPYSNSNGSYASPAPSAGSRSGVSDPFQSGSRAVNPPANSTASGDRGATPSANPYANPFASPPSSRPVGSGYDRPAAAPSYRDYPSTDTPSSSGSATSGSTRYNPPASGYPAGNTGYSAPASDYRPGNTGYNPPASDYRPGSTGYSPASTSPYRSPTSSASPSAGADGEAELVGERCGDVLAGL